MTGLSEKDQDVRAIAYKEGWDDREALLNRAAPEAARSSPQEAGEPVATEECEGCPGLWPDDELDVGLRCCRIEPLDGSPPPANDRTKALEEAVAGIADDYMTSETHHPGYVLIPVAKFERLAALTPAAPAADELPAFEPLMLRGLTFAQALASMRATGCAIRRNHWCAPIVRLVDGRPHLDDEGEVESAPYHPATDDRRAADWEMIPSPELEPDQPEKGGDLQSALAEAEAQVHRLKREIAQGPCVEFGHDWQFIGGKNAACGCSVPVNVCTKCGDCDYGDNADADEIIKSCAEADHG